MLEVVALLYTLLLLYTISTIDTVSMDNMTSHLKNGTSIDSTKKPTDHVNSFASFNTFIPPVLGISTGLNYMQTLPSASILFEAHLQYASVLLSTLKQLVKAPFESKLLLQFFYMFYLNLQSINTISVKSFL